MLVVGLNFIYLLVKFGVNKVKK
uniref:Uncharacterized protein n=1 Tax=Wuchereria bancrofti TaxID=6293 RepID=A0AAF5PI58_WUCBA